MGPQALIAVQMPRDKVTSKVAPAMNPGGNDVKVGGIDGPVWPRRLHRPPTEKPSDAVSFA
jgi:hypothetical protein